MFYVMWSVGIFIGSKNKNMHKERANFSPSARAQQRTMSSREWAEMRKDKSLNCIMLNVMTLILATIKQICQCTVKLI